MNYDPSIKRVKGDEQPLIPMIRTTGASASPEPKKVMTPLTSVVVVCCSHSRVGAFHIVKSVDSSVDVNAKWTVSTAFGDECRD
jgi:hypothetical protein